MNIFSIARKLPAMLAATVLVMGAGQALAADVKVTDKTRAKGMADAPAILSASGAPCQIADAHHVGESNVTTADGKKSKVMVYEVACQTGPGYILAKNPDNTATAFNCTQAASQNALDPKATKCVLPGNAKHYAWLQSSVQTLGSPCVVNNARWIGSSDEAKLDRYELGCESGVGGVLDLARTGSTAKTSFDNCLVMEQRKVTCQFTTREQALAVIKPLAEKASASCQVNNSRLIGRVVADNEDYYEFGCANEPGFLVRAKSSGEYVAKISCANAGTLGPCQYTDAASLTASQNATYTKVLAAAGKPCTVESYNVIGTQTQTNRDFVEFKCPEQVYGLMGFIPNEGSTAKIDIFDCYAGVARKRECSLTPATVLTAHLDKLAKADKKDCDVKEVRYAGVTDSDGILVELACTNKRGYVAALSKTRTSYEDIVACNIAKNRPGYETCKIPGNGTYVSDVQ
ncbi:hypothetical protein [Asticcacaulis machinosus]|uniref:Uncharacterized protein n=1 Tax=Asticcacaulis machinosus TaxID=2984211 RepID=A0ABT5HEG6_9CAUL|nr:hypothetical protein [Asticcacaulis machinosus]MDC7674562.1 hypothetical protein [Asticcacaulis machinosus]